MKYGYARVSTDDQNPALQLAALKRAGCKSVFKDEGLIGRDDQAPCPLRCLKTLQHGDTLTVWKLDRLGRSLRDLIAMLDDLRARDIKFRSLTEAIDTDTPTGRAMWQMIGVLAELERSLISERTLAGVKAAKAPRREIRAQAETNTPADRPRPETPRPGRKAGCHRRYSPREPRDRLSCACPLTPRFRGWAPRFIYQRTSGAW